MVEPPLSPDAYSDTAGTVCPACGGRDLAPGRYASEYPEIVTRRWACENCGASWLAVYELTGYAGLQTPPEDAPYG